MKQPTPMTYKTLVMALTLMGLANVAHAGMVDEENTANPNSEAKADATQQAANQAADCEKAVEEVNEALEKGQEERAKRLKERKDAICSQEFSAAKAEEKKVVEEVKADAAYDAKFANAMGADARDSANYYQEGFAGRQRGTKEMAYVTFDEAKEKNLPYGWTEGTRTSGFGLRDSKQTTNGNYMSSNHKGEDYSIGAGMTEGTDIYSNQNGTVTYAGDKGGYGKTVIVTDANGNSTQYSHLSDINVNVGDTVRTGYQIGDAGSTGNSTGAHLHYGEMANGSYVNPATSSGIKNYDVASVNTWVNASAASGGYTSTSGSGTGSGSGSTTSTNSGLGSDLLSSLTGGSSSSGNALSQMLSQLFSGGSSSDGDSDSDSSSSSSGSSSSTAASDLVTKTVTEVASNGDTTRTTTYADGRTEVLTIKASTTNAEQLNTLLVAILGEDQAASTLASIQALCGAGLSTSSDADMLKVSKCQNGVAS